eukprot:CAMPEP_0183502656 /NCGR_PEP_ID=MMETSP0371-20130417/4385_1 /TAXON_ID=268820 /ORGANISM="Peridinium aciculiferum, Strain PAER-2" /LENGTH=35 /DNA_ID= /DNA_START= /DNA_END= /DNA_ORIENTATION=
MALHQEFETWPSLRARATSSAVALTFKGSHSGAQL